MALTFKRKFIAALCLLLGACASSANREVVSWRTAAAGAATVDTAITILALNHGAEEMNPALGQQPQRIAFINAAIIGAVWYLSKNMTTEQQKTIWRWVTALHLGAAAWNISESK